ncbi:MAG: hypothetical protein KAH38_07150, partial [Candidatus Hydrogenedentes bacterium]|nr:hypothetical protein [Candidatus Hydrogenedentota bacterium]
IRRSFSDPPVPSVTTDASTVNIPGYEETKSYLQRIRDYVHEGGASFIIVTIPATSDIIESQGWYLAIFRLCNELDIQYIDPRPNLNISDYVPPPNGHWNNSGHAKVAEMLLPYMKKTLFGNN